MKKIGMFVLILISLYCNYSYSATEIRVVYGDVQDSSVSSPLGPGITCTPSSNICNVYAAPFTFEQQPVLEHIGFFIPTVPGNPPTVGKGYTDVNVRRTVLPDGSQRYDIEVNPNNTIIYDYQAWREYFEQR
jgi:hypothetical protein